ncbi:MAG TPA: hypothetical protein VFV52_17130 [Bacilli bacterium]|nr:hypothetical protein [Bacilli bacterium]
MQFLKKRRWGGLLALCLASVAITACSTNANTDAEEKEQVTATGNVKEPESQVPDYLRSTWTPPEPEQPPRQNEESAYWDTKPYTSAACPCDFTNSELGAASEEEVLAYLEELKVTFAGRTVEEVMEGVASDDPSQYEFHLKRDGEHAPIVRLNASAPHGANEVPVITVDVGAGFNTAKVYGLIWYENRAWHTQAYPQAPADVAQKRAQVLDNQWCWGQIREIRQQGHLLAVVNDLGGGGTRAAQEVHLLKLQNGAWQAVDIPIYENPGVLMDSLVEFQGEGIDRFTIKRMQTYMDVHPWIEEWQLQGERYVMISRDEYQIPESKPEHDSPKHSTPW